MSITSLKNSRDFAVVCSSPTRSTSKSLSLRVTLKNEYCLANSKSLRIGLIVSKKIGNAVVRNRIKRRLRALCSDVMTQNANADYDYVIFASRHCLNRTFLEMSKDLKFTLHSTNTFVKNSYNLNNNKDTIALEK